MVEQIPFSERRVYLGMPGYTGMTGKASRGFWRATKLPDEQIYYGHNYGSLLAANFNKLWTDALNFAHRGQRVDYFAMQHADIEPQDWWLDSLIDELEAKDLDILGVVAPIKDSKGLTSIALDRPDGDTWRPLCRLTMSEVHRLPLTFTSDDVGHPLLLNTGLWVCRFDPEWAKKVHFTISDRIVFDTVNDRYLAQCEPEDWYFSRLCHELDLKIGCTRKVKLTHRGDVEFPNDKVWGESFDSAWTDMSTLPQDPDGLVPPNDIEGWLTYAEGRELARLAKEKCVLEIGSYYGLSTVCIARTANYVVSVDPHDGRGTPVLIDTYETFVANLKRYEVFGKVSPFVGTFSRFREIRSVDRLGYGSHRFDLIFIDGAHDVESVRSDIANTTDLLTTNGVIVFHDYHSPQDPGVTTAVDELIARGGELVSLIDSLAVVKPPSQILMEV